MNKNNSANNHQLFLNTLHDKLFFQTLPLSQFHLSLTMFTEEVDRGEIRQFMKVYYDSILTEIFL